VPTELALKSAKLMHLVGSPDCLQESHKDILRLPLWKTDSISGFFTVFHIQYRRVDTLGEKHVSRLAVSIHSLLEFWNIYSNGEKTAKQCRSVMAHRKRKQSRKIKTQKNCPPKKEEALMVKTQKN